MNPINTHLLLSLQLAEQAVAKGNHPFGAVLTYKNKVIATAENTVHSDGDITAHAELNLIRRMRTITKTFNVSETTLFASTEPCAMCCGAIYWAGIGSVIFGCSNALLSKIVGGSLEIPSREILSRGTRSVKILGPFSEETFRRVHDRYWNR